MQILCITCKTQTTGIHNNTISYLFKSFRQMIIIEIQIMITVTAISMSNYYTDKDEEPDEEPVTNFTRICI